MEVTKAIIKSVYVCVVIVISKKNNKKLKLFKDLFKQRKFMTRICVKFIKTTNNKQQVYDEIIKFNLI